MLDTIIHQILSDLHLLAIAIVPMIIQAKLNRASETKTEEIKLEIERKIKRIEVRK